MTAENQSSPDAPAVERQAEPVPTPDAVAQSPVSPPATPDLRGRPPAGRAAPAGRQTRARTQPAYGQREYTNVTARIKATADPTIDFARTEFTVNTGIGEEVRHLLGALDIKRLMLVTAADDRLLYDIALGIADAMPSWRHRKLMFGDYGKGGDEVIKLSLLRRPDFDTGEPTLIFVFADSPKAQDFLESLPRTYAEYDHAYERLASTQRVVVLATRRRLRQNNAPLLTASYSEAVDFVGPLVRSYFPDRWSELAADVRQQHRAGLWAADEDAFQEGLKATLVNGTFESEYQRHQTAMRSPSRPQTAAPVAVPRLDSDVKPVHFAACFAGVFFNAQRVEDFNRVVLSLLHGRHEPASSAAPPPASPQPTATPSPAVTPPPVPAPRPLTEVWETQRRQIMADCGLNITGRRPAVVDFEDISIREQLEQSFMSDEYFAYDDLSRRLEGAGFMFSKRADIASAATALIARRVLADPQSYGEDLLPRLLAPLDAVVERMLPWAGDLEPLGQDIRRRVQTQLAALFNLLCRDGADDQVSHVLSRLMALGRRDDVLGVLARVSDSSFDPVRLAFTRRLLDEGDEEIRARAYQQLLRWLLDGGPRTANVLDAMFLWDDGSGAPHSVMPTRILADMVLYAINQSPSLEAHPIASVLTSAQPEIAERLVTRLAGITSTTLAAQLGTDAEIVDADTPTLLLTFLWILPPAPGVHADVPESWWWGDVQAAWFAGYLTTLDKLAGDGIALERTFAALALADCATVLAANPELSARAMDTIGAVLHQLPHHHRQALKANWASMRQGLLRCMTVPWPHRLANRNGATATADTRNLWKTMRASVQTLATALRPRSFDIPKEQEHGES